MSISISSQSYGKARVCLSYVTRHADRHDFIQLAVEIALQGDFDTAYVDGDNSKVIPTDTMKNSVYGIARKCGVENIEAFGQDLANHFFDSFDHVDSATVSVVESLWQRIDSDGSPHRHGFVGGGSEQNTCQVTRSSDGTKMKSGLCGLQVLKTTDSGFEGFLQDQFTTLKETNDRIFATTITKNSRHAVGRVCGQVQPLGSKDAARNGGHRVGPVPRSQRNFAQHAEPASPSG